MKTILVTGARAPVALHWARLLKEAGHRVLLADTQVLPLSRPTRFKDRYVRLPRPIGQMPVFKAAVERLLAEERPDLVLPTCEEIFYLAALRDRHGLSIPLLAPHFDQLSAMHDKFRFATFARALDGPVTAPETFLIRDAADAEPLLSRARSLVLKPVWSRFGDRVLRRPEPAVMAGMDWQGGGPWVAQTYLPGEELSAYALARDGTLLAHQAYRGLFRAGGGASVAFAPVREPDIEAFLRAFVARRGWHGQVSFDFRRDEAGRIHVIECNPRAVSGLHFFAPGDGLVKALFGGGPARASIGRPQTVRLALLTYGLAEAFSSGRFRAWGEAWQQCGDLTDHPGDRSFGWVQAGALAEIALLALRHRTGLKTAATADMEWNGEPL